MIVPQTVTFVKLLDSAKPAFLRVQIRIHLALFESYLHCTKRSVELLLGLGALVASFLVVFLYLLSLATGKSQLFLCVLSLTAVSRTESGKETLPNSFALCLHFSEYWQLMICW